MRALRTIVYCLLHLLAKEQKQHYTIWRREILRRISEDRKITKRGCYSARFRSVRWLGSGHLKPKATPRSTKPSSAQADADGVIEVIISDLNLEDPRTVSKGFPAGKKIPKVPIPVENEDTGNSGSIIVSVSIFSIFAICILAGVFRATNLKELSDYVGSISKTFKDYLPCIVAFWLGASSKSRKQS